ncbi:hypothetical protein GNI_067350 [Gregarina niphandrodes]|uniref:Uncharacterized protein n=1 Tax=Gregarina niphandrodes TaxID=110365 RepID=A0A023B7S0_GRENI|nr:hypothetical protein GNI_067350 [Gregarina niphandrodes]EZG67639.1 hypothetical protein GNI_067350 [Gregarina niphandrodes]|eukprot:XP_011130192.1 hypothetical protein GNI_067350 [Gregarina niphandrodes]
MYYSIEDFTVANTFENLVDLVKKSLDNDDTEFLFHGLPVDPLKTLGFDRGWLELKILDNSVKMHTANTMLIATKNRLDIPLVVYCKSQAWEQWLALEYRDGRWYNYLIVCDDMGLEFLVKLNHLGDRREVDGSEGDHHEGVRWSGFGITLNEQFRLWLSGIKNERIRSCLDPHRSPYVYHSILHYCVRHGVIPHGCEIFEGYDVVDEFEIYERYNIDRTMADLFEFRFKPFERIYVIKHKSIKLLPVNESMYESMNESMVEYTWLRTVKMKRFLLPDFSRILRQLKEYATLPTEPATLPTEPVSNIKKHIYPSRELLGLLFINDDASNEISLGLALLLDWSLSKRFQYSYSSYIQKLRGSISIYHSSLDWLEALTMKNTRCTLEQTYLKKNINSTTDDPVLLLDRILLSYIKLSLFTTLSANRIQDLIKFRYVIVKLLLLVPTFSTKNFLLFLSKINNSRPSSLQAVATESTYGNDTGNTNGHTHREDLSIPFLYRTVITAIRVTTYLGGDAREVWRELMNIYPDIQLNVAHDLYLRSRYDQPTFPKLDFNTLCNDWCDITQPVRPYLPINFQDLIHDYEFELEDSYNDLLTSSQNPCLSVYCHSTKAFERILSCTNPHREGSTSHELSSELSSNNISSEVTSHELSETNDADDDDDAETNNDADYSKLDSDILDKIQALELEAVTVDALCKHFNIRKTESIAASLNGKLSSDFADEVMSEPIPINYPGRPRSCDRDRLVTLHGSLSVLTPPSFLHLSLLNNEGPACYSWHHNNLLTVAETTLCSLY